MKKILFVIISILILTGCNKKEEVTNLIKVNQNENIIKEQVVSNLTLTDVSLYYEKGLSTFNAKIKNDTENDIAISDFNIVFKNENGTIIIKLKENDINIIEANSSKNISIVSDIDLSNAYSVEYEIK